MSAGIFSILKNISMLADDVVSVSKTAIKDTVCVLGDDLAVNAEKASKFLPSREIPVLIKITKGSILNKILLVPVLILISYIFPFLVSPILVLGAIFLSYEGICGLQEVFGQSEENDNKNENENEKIKAAINTDRILSIEIIVIALNAVAGTPIIEQFFIVSFVAFLATIGVYGIVALIVRFDDMGLWLIKKSIKNEENITLKYKIEPNENIHENKTKTYVNFHQMYFGSIMINSMSKIIKALTYIGLIAMFLVAGEIFIHKIAFFHEYINMSSIFSFIPSISLSLIVGVIAKTLFAKISILSSEK